MTPGDILGHQPIALAGLAVCLVISGLVATRQEPGGDRRVGPRDVVLVALVAAGLRLLFALVQDGAVFDIQSYRIVGEQLRHGVDVFVQPALGRQNYPPVVVWWSALCTLLTPSNLHLFALLEKSLFCASDAAVAVSLLWIAPAGMRRRAALLYALSPIAITVCALHGQFDALVILPLIWSLHLARRHPRRAALLFGVALAVKTWPLFFLPVILVRMRPKAALGWTLTAAAPPLLAFAAYAAVHPQHLVAGFLRLATYAGASSPLGLGPLDLTGPWAAAFNIALLAALAVVAWRTRTSPLHAAYSGSICLLLALSPTVSAQYTVWPVAGLLAAGRTRLSIVYAAATLPVLSVMVLWLYQGVDVGALSVLARVALLGWLAVGAAVLGTTKEPDPITDPNMPGAAPPRPRSRPASISAVLPAYNEEAIIATTLRRTHAALTATGAAVEVVVVDDGSADGTRAECERVAADLRGVRVLVHPVNRGYGCALQTGVEAATGTAVFLMDSDGQFDPADIGRLLEHWDDRAVVCGYRAVRNDPWIRRLNHDAFFMLVDALFGRTARDINCAFKLFPRTVGRGLSAEGALIGTELVVRARDSGYRIVDVAVPHHPRRTGSPTGARLSVILRAFVELGRLRRRLARERSAVMAAPRSSLAD